MRNPDILPRKDADFDTLQHIVLQQTQAHTAEWQIPSTAFTPLIPLQTAWQNAWQKARVKTTRSMVDVAAKKTARKNYEKELRRFIQMWIKYNEQMQPEHKQLCGIKPVKKTRTRHPVTNAVPLLQITPHKHFMWAFYFRQQTGEEGQSKRRMPDGVVRLEIVYAIGTPPETPDNCPKRLSATRSPLLVQFDTALKGVTIYAYARWVNTREEKGPWTGCYMFEL